MLNIDIKKKLGNFTLDVDLTLNLETLALFGASGCGKSMTLKCIAGIETPDQGEIILNDRILFSSHKNINLPPQDRRVGLLFQSYALFPNMTLRENIEIAIRGGSKKSKEVDSLIDNFSLKGLESHYPNQLSGGQQQRVALARMLINEPELLMLDEPFSALDEHLSWQMENEFLAILRSYKVPTIYVSHNKNEVYRISDSVAIMDRGKILEVDCKERIFKNPKSMSTALLIGYKNISRIKKIASGSYLAEDWKLNLSIADNKNYKYLAISEDSIGLADNPSGENTFVFYVQDIIENIDSTSLVLNSLDEDSSPIYLRLDSSKTRNMKVKDRVFVYFPREDFKLFY